MSRRQKAPYLSRRLVAAHQLLANPTATDAQRRGARCRINRTMAVMRRLTPIAPMTRRLDVDVLAEKARNRAANRDLLNAAQQAAYRAEVRP